MKTTSTSYDLRSVINNDSTNAKVIRAILCVLCRNGYVHYDWGWEDSDGNKIKDEDTLDYIEEYICNKVERFVNILNDKTTHIGRIRVSCNLARHQVWISETTEA